MQRKLLIIEDDPEMGYLLGTKAARLNFLCDIDETGAEWPALLHQGPPDAILLDMDLPRMSGFSILRQLKAQDAYRGIPVFVWSGTSDPEVIDEAKDLGARDYFLKSKDLNELFREISSALRS